jgi:type IV pilus assembly protein PilM
MEFLTLKPEAFGLDISDLSLKIIKLKKKRGVLSLASFGETEIKPGIIRAGEIKDEKKLAEIIKEAMEKVKGEKIKTKYVVASLPEEKAFLQVITLPRMSEEDLKSAVIYEAENYIPLPIEEVYLDSQIVPPVYNHLDHFDVLIAALPKKTVDPYISSLKLAGLKPKALEIESLAITRALIKNEITTSPVLLIDLGATRTSFIIFSGHSLRFTSSIPVSSGAFTEIISKALGVNLAEAEKLKIKHGLEEKIQIKIKGEKIEKERERGKIFEALVPALVDLIQQIKRCLEYYQTHAAHEHLPPDGKGVSKILLCGGGANLKGLTDSLSLQLKIPTELGNPWINILPEPQKEVKELPFEESLKYTTALGLALRGIKEKL